MPVRLNIRVQHIEAANGTESTATTVDCPQQKHAVDVDLCASCGKFVGLQLHPAKDAFVSCQIDRSSTPAERDRGTDSLDLPRAFELSAHVPISMVMTREITAVRSDVGVERIVEILVEKGIGSVPVVDDKGRAVGVVSKTDILWMQYESAEVGGLDAPLGIRTRQGWHYPPRACESTRRASEARAGDIMTPLAFSIRHDAPMSHAIGVLAGEQLHRLFVVDADGVLVGVLSTVDVVRWLARPNGRHTRDK